MISKLFRPRKFVFPLFLCFFLLFYYFKRCCDNPFYGRKKLELVFASFWSLIRNEPIYINVVVIRKAISYLGPAHYLSHWGRGGGGTEDFSGDQLIFRRTKGGISRNWEPRKGESLKTLEGFRRGTTQICLESEDMGRGLRKSSKVIRGDHFREVTLKGGITLFSPKSSPVPQAINNDRALIKSCEQIEPSFAFLSDEEIKKRRLCLNKVKPFKSSQLMIKLLD